MPHFKKDIRGDACEKCKVGKAHVVYFAKRNRFFFLVATPARRRSRARTKEWQSVDVPDSLRVMPDWAKQNTDVVKKDSRREKNVWVRKNTTSSRRM